ncbi:MAG: hypothetical protein LBE38_02835 [Deltaproteobacteria bacterium]|jgi:Rod binding domain-containing protein|nr:hypothetical protein [Deltaproteobacteria bacterium]
MAGTINPGGLTNLDVKALTSTSKAIDYSNRGAAASRGSSISVSVEELRKNGINFSSSGTGGKPVDFGSSLKSTNEANEGSASGRYEPLSYRIAHSGGNLSEEEQLAKLQKIRDSAREYEGLLMAEMIKAMRQSPFSEEPGSDTYAEIAEKPFTAALTKAGGLGLADKIVEDVAAQEGLSGVLAAHPEVMGPNWKMRIAPSRRFKQSGMQNVANGARGDENVAALAQGALSLSSEAIGSGILGESATRGLQLAGLDTEAAQNGPEGTLPFKPTSFRRAPTLKKGE